MLPNTGGDKSLPVESGVVHRAGRVHVERNSINDENLLKAGIEQQNLRIQQAVHRYNGTVLPSHWKMPSAAYKCSLLKAKSLRPLSTDSGSSSDSGSREKPERYPHAGHFPTVFLGKTNTRFTKKQSNLSQLRMNSVGLPVSRFMDDTAEKYSDLKSTRSVLDVLQDLSRKRINGKDDCEESSKRRCVGLGGDLVQEHDIPYKPLFVAKSKHQPSPKKDQTTQTNTDLSTNGTSETPPPKKDSKWEIRKRLAQKNNEIFASLSSSINGLFSKRKRVSETNNFEEKEGQTSKKPKLRETEILQETVQETPTSRRETKPSGRDGLSPRTPPTKDRLMSIYFDLQSAGEVKRNVIQSLQSSPGDTQFQRSTPSPDDTEKPLNWNATPTMPVVKSILKTSNPSSPAISTVTTKPLAGNESLSSLSAVKAVTPTASLATPTMSPALAPALKFGSDVATSNTQTPSFSFGLKKPDAALPGTPSASPVTSAGDKPTAVASGIQFSAGIPYNTAFGVNPAKSLQSKSVSPSSVSGGISFGTLTDAKTSAPFSFGKPASPVNKQDQIVGSSPASVTTSTTGNAQQAASAALNELPKPASFSFGSLSPSKAPSSGVAKLDATAPATTAAPPPFTFGQTKAPAFSFGQNSLAAAATSNSLTPTAFGQTEAAKSGAQSSTFSFGQPRAEAPSSTNLAFGPPKLVEATLGSVLTPTSTTSRLDALPSFDTRPIETKPFSFGLSAVSASNTVQPSSFGASEKLKSASDAEGSNVKWSLAGPANASKPVSNVVSTASSLAPTSSAAPASSVFARLGPVSQTSSDTSVISTATPGFGSMFKSAASAESASTNAVKDQPTSTLFSLSKADTGGLANVFGSTTPSGSLFKNAAETLPAATSNSSLKPASVNSTAAPMFGQASSLFAPAPTTQSAVSSTSFGKSNEKPVFSFGQAANAAPSLSQGGAAFSFGQAAPNVTTAPSSQPATQAPAASTPFSFGAAKTETASSTASTFSFGKTANVSTTQGFALGASTTAPLFGQASNGNEKSGFSFGQSSNVAPFAFGQVANTNVTTATTAASSQPAPAFGAAAAQPATVPATTSSGFNFGQSVAPPAFPSSTPYQFGASNLSAGTAPFSLPGSTSQGSTTVTSSFGNVSTPAFGSTTNAGFGTTSAFGAASSAAPAFGATSSAAPAFGSTASAAPGFGSTASSASGFGTPASAAPAFGTMTSSTAPAFGVTAASTMPAFGSSTFGTSTSAFGSTSTPAFGNSATPSFGSSSVPAFGSSAPPAFGSTTASSTPGFGGASTPAFGSAATQFKSAAAPAFGNSTSPAFGSAATAFGNTTAPAFGSAAAPTFNSSTPAFGSSPAPAFGNTSTPAFGSTSAPYFGNSASSTFGGTPTPSFGSTPSSAGTPFAFGASGATNPPAFNFGSAQAPSGSGSSGGSFNFGANSASTAGGAFSFGSNNSGFGQTPAPGSNGFATPFGQTPPAGAFPVPGTFNIGSGSSQPRSRTTSRASRRRP